MENIEYDTSFTKEEIISYYTKQEVELGTNITAVMVIIVLSLFLYMPALISLAIVGTDYATFWYTVALTAIQLFTICAVGKDVKAAAMFRKILKKNKTLADVVRYVYSIADYDTTVQAAYIVTCCSIQNIYLTDNEETLVIQYTDGISDMIFHTSNFKNLVNNKLRNKGKLTVTKEGLMLCNA